MSLYISLFTSQNLYIVFMCTSDHQSIYLIICVVICYDCWQIWSHFLYTKLFNIGNISVWLCYRLGFLVVSAPGFLTLEVRKSKCLISSVFSFNRYCLLWPWCQVRPEIWWNYLIIGEIWDIFKADIKPCMNNTVN